MPAKLQCVVLDCPDPATLARFYQVLLGGEIDRQDPRWRLDGLSTLHLDGMVLAFQRAADHRPPRWPDPAYPQQVHLDFEVDDLAEAHRQIVAGGGALLQDTDDWSVYADPAGHPFCLVG
jgi:catechol 2,3-dioxygenase-like lactoylglutathione lyase family enzyme